MSVMACNREGCDNIMCDRYAHDIGYICNECYQELLVAKTHWPFSVPKDEVKQRIIEFMNTNKGHTYNLQGSEIDNEFDSIMGNHNCPDDEFDY